MTNTEIAEAANEAKKDYKIIVNAQEKTVTSRSVTFDQVVTLAFGSVDPNYRYTVTYRKALAPKHEGIMTTGETVEVKDGTIFDVARTYKS